MKLASCRVRGINSSSEFVIPMLTECSVSGIPYGPLKRYKELNKSSGPIYSPTSALEQGIGLGFHHA